MTRLHWVLWMSFALALTSLAAEREVQIDSDECWWGAAAGFGTQMPFTRASSAEIDLTRNNYSQQCDSLLLSDRGRLIYSAKPARISVTNGIIRFASEGEIVVRTSGTTLREAFKCASRSWFPASGRMPAELFFSAPQYNTWVELNYHQNQDSILQYARDFLKNGCPPGVFMIDDTWQLAYGEWCFDPRRFPDPKGMCDELHRMGFKVMLWICPWVGMDTPAYRRVAFGSNPFDCRGYPTKGGFRMQKALPNFPAPNRWWNGYSALLDFTHPNARAWFKEQLDRLVRDYGIDGFKFDGGEFDHYTEDAFPLKRGISPAEESYAYAVHALDYPYCEYRNGWHLGGQPIIQRLIDKPHTWEAVRQLVPDMIAAGLLGYQFICPDMAGGGMWTAFLPGAKIDQEIFVRSVQVHALCGQMQFSASPWRILDEEHQDAVRQAVTLRQKFAPYILEVARACAKSGEPMVRNLEYAYPRQGYADVRDEFLLGDKLLVVPQLATGETRRVTIPSGRWKSDLGRVVEGPCVVVENVPLSRLPHYMMLSENEQAFENPIGSEESPDPFVVWDGETDYYYLLFTRGKEVRIFRSKTVSGLRDGESRVVYEPKDEDGIVGAIWAPEMHKAPNGKLYVYTSGLIRRGSPWGPKRLFILESKTTDPFDGFVYKGKPAPDLYAIDPTVMTWDDGKQYVCYSEVKPKGEQVLVIREMENPWTFGSRQAEIAHAELAWELVDQRINEGAFFVRSPSGNRLFCIYSANGCWCDDYALGVLEFTGGDLCDAKNWKKHPSRLLVKGKDAFGPGHASFFTSPDDSELWCAYHAMRASNPDRKAAKRWLNLQRVSFDETGYPVMGEAIGTRPQRTPSDGM